MVNGTIYKNAKVVTINAATIENFHDSGSGDDPCAALLLECDDRIFLYILKYVPIARIKYEVPKTTAM